MPALSLSNARVRPSQIVALGGGGFSEEANPALDQFVLEASGVERPRVCFLPTAGGDSASYVVKFYSAFGALQCVPTHLALFNRKVSDARSLLLAQDVIYVGGGNTVNLLAVWRAHGIDQILREAWESGVVLAGLCGGSMCWFEGGVTAAFGGELVGHPDGLGFLAGTNCPHYRQRAGAYSQAMREGLGAGIGVDDGVAVHFVGQELVECVASREGRGAYQVGRLADQEIIEPLPVRLLSPRAPGALAMEA